jgi:prepilin-type N-terminal cleavage/methylation domain-containing protein
MKKGFTLIELLVVIAIIGILASVVLIGFPSATKKANDSRVISAIGQARTIMTYIGANEGDYADFEDVSTSSEMHVIWNEINDNDNDDDTPEIHGGTEQEGACIYAQLNAKTTYWYCADSTGVAGTTGTDPDTTCGGTGVGWACPTLD